MKTDFNFTGEHRCVVDVFGRLTMYNLLGNDIYSKSSDGLENWDNFDSSNNRIYSRQSDGTQRWWEYDAVTNLVIHYREVGTYTKIEGYEEWFDYDSSGRITHLKDSDGNEIWYDCTGHEISKEEWVLHNK